MFLICHMNSCEHVLQELCDFLGGNPVSYITNFPCLVGVGFGQVNL